MVLGDIWEQLRKTGRLNAALKVLDEVASSVSAALVRAGFNVIPVSPTSPIDAVERAELGRVYKLEGWQPRIPYAQDMYLVFFPLVLGSEPPTIHGALTYFYIKEVYEQNVPWRGTASLAAAGGLESDAVRAQFIDTVIWILTRMRFVAALINHIDFAAIARGALNYINTKHASTLGYTVDDYDYIASFQGRKLVGEWHTVSRRVVNSTENYDRLSCVFYFYPAHRRDALITNILKFDCSVVFYHREEQAQIQADITVRNNYSYAQRSVAVNAHDAPEKAAGEVQRAVLDALTDLAGRTILVKRERAGSPEFDYKNMTYNSFAQIVSALVANAYALVWESVLGAVTGLPISCTHWVGQLEERSVREGNRPLGMLVRVSVFFAAHYTKPHLKERAVILPSRIHIPNIELRFLFRGDVLVHFHVIVDFRFLSAQVGTRVAVARDVRALNLRIGELDALRRAATAIADALFSELAEQAQNITLVVNDARSRTA